AALGVAIGLATMTRGEALLLAPLLVLLLMARGPRPWRWKAARSAALLGAFALVLAPWTIRNALTFADPVIVSDNANAVWVGSNCQETYYGPIIGLWHFPCYAPAPRGDESQRPHA